MKLTDARNAKEVLPGKMPIEGLIANQMPNRRWNSAIDAYNNVDFGGDVEALAKDMYEDFESLKGIIPPWEKTPEGMKVFYRERATDVILRMPTWVVVKKEQQTTKEK